MLSRKAVDRAAFTVTGPCCGSYRCLYKKSKLSGADSTIVERFMACIVHHSTAGILLFVRMEWYQRNNLDMSDLGIFRQPLLVCVSPI